MSRDFATIGVQIPAARLLEISAGSPVCGAEHIDVNFALVATAFNHHTRVCKFQDVRRHAARWLLVAAMVVLSLAVLIALTLLMLSMVQPTFQG